YKDYVVKIFKQSYLERGQPIYSEVFGNIFDTLILHKDRRKEKPNLFFKADEVYLIDYESVLVIGQQTYSSLLANGTYKHTIHRYGRPHLFLDFLSKQQNTATKPDFAMFYEYLRYLDTAVLDGYVEQLTAIEQARFLRHEGDEIFDYMRIKQTFVLSLPHDEAFLRNQFRQALSAAVSSSGA
ncbi:MAG: hypothetical protein RI894_729, partial [Bacteroidota bacterium]